MNRLRPPEAEPHEDVLYEGRTTGKRPVPGVGLAILTVTSASGKSGQPL